jgi:autotransporter-associated beta strand protein
MKHAPSGALSRASLLACAALCGTNSAQAASQVWSDTATDALFQTGTNWVGGAAPGTAAGGYANATRNNDIATFNAAVGTFGGAANPIQTDVNRFLKGFTFDTAAAGSHVVGVAGGSQLQLDQAGLIVLNPTVENPQTVNADIRVRAQSSFNPTYTLRNNATLSTATLTVGGTLQIACSTGRGTNWTLDGSNTGDNLFNGIFSTSAGTGSGGFTALTKTGTGTWRVTGTNTLPSVAVNNGTLIASTASALGTAGIAVSGGTLQFDNLALSNSLVTLSGTGTVKATGASSINLATVSAAAPSTAAFATDVVTDVLTVGTGVNSVTGGQAGSVLAVTGPGTVILPAVGTYVGTWTVNSGILQTNVPNALGSSPSVNFDSASTGILRLNGNNATIAGLSSSVTPGTATVENGSATPLTLTSNPTTNVAFHGLLQDGGAGSLALVKGGAGSLTLAAANTYTGGTTVSQGALVVTNTTGSATGSGPLAVNATGVLGGTGSVAGAVTVASGGKVAPGTTVGNLTVTSLDLDSGSTLDFEFSGANDLITVSSSGGLTIDGGAITLLQEGTSNPFSTPGTYNLISYSGSILGTGEAALTVANPQPGFGYSFAASGTHVTLTIATTGAIRNWTNPAGGSWANNSNWDGTFPTAQGDSANFTTNLVGGPATVTLDGNKTVGGIIFTSPANSYTITQGSGGSLTLDNGGSGASILDGGGVHFLNVPITLTSNTVIDTAALADSITLGDVVSGPGTLTKTGPGSLFLSGSNTFLGKLTLSGGTTTFATGGLGAGNLDIDASTLVWDTGNTQDITAGRTITFGNNPVTFNTNGNDVTLANDVGNSGSSILTKAGVGKLTLVANTSFTGNVTLAAGSLELGNGGATGSILATTLVNNGALFVNRSADLLMTSNIGGSGSLAVAGGGKLKLSGTNTFTGNTTVAAGSSIAIFNALALQSSTLLYPSTGGSLDFDTSATATLGALDGNKDLVLTNSIPGPVALTVGGNNATTTYSGILSGDGSLTKTGTGVMTLSTAHSYLGGTNVANGGNTGGLTLENGAVINGGAVNVTQSSNLIVNTGASLTASAASSVNNAGTTNPLLDVVGGSVAFNGGLNALGNANNNYLIRVNGGTFTASAVNLGRGSLNQALVEPGATGLTNSANLGLVVMDGVATISGALNVGGTSTSINSTASARINGGSLTVSGALTIGVNNGGRYSGFDVTGGTFTSTDPVGGVILGQTVAGPAAFLVRGGVSTVERIQFGQAAVNSIAVTHVFAGQLYVGTGGMVLGSTEPGFVATLKLSGGILGAKGNWETTLPVITANTFEVKAADAANASFNIDLKGAVSGTGSLRKTGIGTVALTGTYTYSGSTEVDAGTLQLDTATLSDTAPVDVSATGSGTIFLNHGSVDTVSAFRIDGVDQGSGTFTSLTHPGRISGGGSLYVAPSDPFIGWASDRGLTGLDAAKTADPDKDGLDNLQEFAFDGNPTSGAASGKIRSRIETVGADQALVITLPVRSGAIFAGTPAKAATIDEVIYTIQGSNTLAAFDQVVSEIPESSAGMPSLSTGWSYRTFRLDGAIPARGATGFLRTDVADAAP